MFLPDKILFDPILFILKLFGLEPLALLLEFTSPMNKKPKSKVFKRLEKGHMSFLDHL